MIVELEPGLTGRILGDHPDRLPGCRSPVVVRTDDAGKGGRFVSDCSEPPSWGQRIADLGPGQAVKGVGSLQRG